MLRGADDVPRPGAREDIGHQAAQPAQRRSTVADYERMGEAGILHENDRVEPINGEIVEMSPIGAPRVTCANRFNRLLVQQFGARATVSVQNPVRLSGDSEPQPDFAVLRDPDFSGVPSAADVLLVTEVFDTTLPYDRRVKLPLYAAAGISES